MTTNAGQLALADALVLDYLAALWAESEDLEPGLRDELMATVNDYLAARRSAPLREEPEAIVRRLGDPAKLVADCRTGRIPLHLRLPALVAAAPPLPPAGPHAGAAEYVTVGLLTAGAFVLPVAGPTAGMLLATGSPYWSGVDKAVGWTLVAGAAIASVFLFAFLGLAGLSAVPAALMAYLVMSGGCALAGLRMADVMRRRGAGG